MNGSSISTPNWPIKRESFVQWVIEDTLPEPKPSWDKVGVIFTNDVNGFEMTKLRLLNCLHSTLAYIGSLMGIETVFDAMQSHLVMQADETSKSLDPQSKLATLLNQH